MTPAEAAEAATRPRVEGEREREILEATLDVLVDVGYDRLTMDAVAAAARASKATLYRRWNSKATLVIQALAAQKSPGPLPDTGTLREDLLAMHCGVGGVGDARQTAVFASVLTAISRDAEFADAFRTEFLGPKLDRSMKVFRRARERGEVRTDIDLDIIAPALAGILIHRMFVLGRPPTDEAAVAVVDQLILPAVLVEPASSIHSSDQESP